MTDRLNNCQTNNTSAAGLNNSQTITPKSSAGNIAYISLGSNLGNKEANLRQALHLLESDSQIAVTRISSFYKTAPIGYTHQDWFINAAAELHTALTPFKLLQQLQAVENILGRIRTIHWGPRTLDLDLLLYNQLQLAEPRLTLPHPRLTERAFVVVPLLEIAPDVQLPDRTYIRDLPLEPLSAQAIIKIQ